MRGEELQPFRRRLGVFGRDDFHLVAGFERMAQLHQFLVHFGGDGLVTHFRVDEEGKIQGCCALLDAALLSLGGEDVYFRGREVVVDDVQQLQRIHVRIHQDFLDAVEPVVHLIVTLSHPAVLLVNPVGGNAFFGDVVHAARADLHFHPNARIAEQGAVQGLVAVGFGVFHPVPQSFRHISVYARNDGEDMVALVSLALLGIGVVLKDDADGIQVVNLVEGNSFRVHLAPGRIGRLDAFLDFILESCGIQRFLDRFYEIGHFLALFPHFAVYPGLDILIGFRLLETQPDVLQLAFDAVQAQPVCQGDEDEHGFAQDLVPLVLRHMLDGAAVVQTVGQFDEHHAHIVVHRQEDALEILGLQALLGDVRAVGLLLRIQHVLDLGESVHQRSNFVPETLPEVFHGVVRVFHNVVQGGRYGLVAQADVVHYNLGYGDGMQHVRLSAAPAHVLVRLVGKLESPLHYFQFCVIGAPLFSALEQFGVVPRNQFVVLLGKL